MFKEEDLGIVETKIATFDKLELENGSILSPIEIAYETYGLLSPNKDNVILICHALSGDAHAAGYHQGDKKPGWWNNYIGEGKAFDTKKFFIVSSNVIGGCMGSTGPTSINPKTNKPYGSSFPYVSIKDFVFAQKLLLDSLKIYKLFCVAGGSMGGMQSLQWSVSFPDMVENCIIIASSAEHSALQIAYNEVGRQAILSDPNWNKDDLKPTKGLALARMLGHITYLSDEKMREKFGRNPPKGNIQSSEFAVGSYLIYQGESFVDRFDANSYIYVTRALDHFSLGRGKELTKSLKNVKSKFLIISFSSDWLYTTAQSKDIVKSLEANDKRVSFLEINTNEGHDAFLNKNDKLADTIGHFLENNRIK